jgi:membrane protein
MATTRAGEERLPEGRPAAPDGTPDAALPERPAPGADPTRDPTLDAVREAVPPRVDPAPTLIAAPEDPAAVREALHRRRSERWRTARTPVGGAHAHAAALAAEERAERDRAPRPSLWTRTVRGAQGLWTRWSHSRAGRANARFGAAGGGVLTGGIAYSALFSLFAALALGYTIFMAVLGGNDALRQDVLDAVDANLPGLVDTGDGDGLIDPDQLILTTGLSLAGLGAIAVLIYSASMSMAALRTAVRAVFGASAIPQNVFVGKARELAGVAGVAVAVLLSAVLTLAVTSLADLLLGALGWGDATRVVGRVLGIAVALVVDAGMFVLVLRVLAGLHPPRRDVLSGAVLAGVGMGAVRLLGTSVVAGSADRNALLASFTVLVTLLVWINLLARIVLLAAAWTADPPLPETDGETTGA